MFESFVAAEPQACRELCARADLIFVNEAEIGAGEILAGAFLALRARGLTEEQALTYSVAVAARSVTEFGVAGPAVAGELERVRAELGSRRAAGAA